MPYEFNKRGFFVKTKGVRIIIGDRCINDQEEMVWWWPFNYVLIIFWILPTIYINWKNKKGENNECT